MSLSRRARLRLHHRRQSGSTVLSPHVGRKVTLGLGCHVKDGAVLRAAHLGAGCYVNRGAEIYEADVGPYCSIGQGAQIGANAHLTDEVTTCNGLYGAAQAARLAARNAARTTLGADVWIGARAIVLRGLRIGPGAIVAAGAVVTRDVPAYGVVAGVPAHLLRHRFEEETAAALIAARWWDRPRGDIRAALEASAQATTPEDRAHAFLAALEGPSR